ncbi:MAG: endonuclease/exonuclease/phosphatase family protein [Oligoflexia bacterium]|nr:endonuclease/exonuclease/phosphatase family protein [Oligoflexia bacterium]
MKVPPATSLSFLLVSLLTSFACSQSQASSCYYDCLVVPLLSDSVVSIGNPATKASSAAALPSQGLEVLVWNIHKGMDRPFVPEFRRLSRDADLVLLQEAVVDPAGRAPFLSRSPELDWKLGISWISKEYQRTGPATGSRAPILSTRFQRSPDLEPGAKTPKANLLTLHPLAGTDELLLVVNIHAINFRAQDSLERQLALFRDELWKHRGPVLVAGDFNTWSEGRLIAMRDSLEGWGLSHAVPFRDPRRGLILDHVWTRGLRIESLQVIETDGSDHPAFRLRVALDS